MYLLSKEELLYGLFHVPMAISSPFISWYFFTMSGGDYIGSGLIITIPYLFLISSTSFLGWLSDRIGSKNLIMASLFTLFISYIVYALIENDPLIFFICYIIFNIITSAFIPAFNRLVSFVDPVTRSKMFGRLGMWASLGFLFGSFITWVLLDTIGFRSMLIIASVISLIGFFFSTTLPRPGNELGIEPNKRSFSTFSPKNVYSLNKIVIIMLVLVIITQMSNSVVLSFFAIFVENELHQTIGSVAIVNTIATIAGALSTYSIGHINSRLLTKRPLFLFAGVLYTILPLISFVSIEYPIIILLIYTIPLYSIYFVTVPSFLSENSKDSARGEIMGYFGSSQYIGLAAGTLIGAFMASINNAIRPNFLIASFIGFLGLLIAFFYFKDSPIVPSDS
ncbi:MAG: MFS transporter [Candidatus Hodarchaeales archaeon]